MKPLVRLLLTAILILAPTAPVISQATSSLRGTVTDPTGAVLPDVTVTLTEEDTGVVRTTTTGADGAYLFPQLRPGTYRVEFEKEGFKTTVRRNLEILVATPLAVDVALEVGAVAETVEVTAAVAAINTTDATIGNTFGERQVKELPLSARNAVALLTLQPGVVFTGESDIDLLSMGTIADLEDREGVVNGVRSNQTNVTLDGVDANDPQNQGAFTSAVPVTLDSLQEFRVVTSNANPDAGVAAGAQVELVTKSGTNDWHGNARWFHRNDATAATPFFNNAAGVDKPKQIRNQFGLSVGGPLKKDRAFFFLDWEQRRDNSEASVLQSVPSDLLKTGVLSYVNTNGDVVSLTPAQFALLDPRPNDADMNGVTDPECDQSFAAGAAGCGVNPFMLAYMGLFPAGNSPGDAFDGGFAFNGLRFNGPVQVRNNIYTARFDFTLDAHGHHTVYWRGTLGDIKHQITTPPFFPGFDPSGDFLNNGKGMAIRYTGLHGPNFVHSFSYGLTRAGIEQTGQDGDFFGIRNFSTHKPYNRAFGHRIPTHNFRDDITWSRGRHTLQAGLNVRFIRNDRFTRETSFPAYSGNPGFCANFCLDIFDALFADADPNNDPSDFFSFASASIMLTGAIPQASANFLVDPSAGTFFPFGTPQAREFAENDFEFYLQDSWRIRPSLQLTLGLRYSYFGPIWEKNGLQVRPTVDVNDWWNQRINAAAQGLPTDTVPLLAFDLAGKANGAPAWYDPDKNNWAPRVAIAWSPQYESGLGRLLFGKGEGVLRAGAGLYYHRVGGALAVGNDVNGSPGLGNFVISPVAAFGIGDAPRFTGTCTLAGCTGLPNLSLYLNVPSATFPATPSTFSDNVGFMVDNDLKTPYSMNFALSYQREFKGFTFEGAYVGTLGRQLLTKTDFAQVMWNFRDPASGATLEQAYNQIVDLMGPGFLTASTFPGGLAIDPFDPAQLQSIAAIPFFENVFTDLCFQYSFLFACNNSTQAFYGLATLFAASWTDLLFLLDVSDPIAGFCNTNPTLDPECYGLPGPGVPGRLLFQPQFNSLAGWMNWGSSNYHSLQLSLRRTVGNVVFHANYVLSKSIDNGSTPENADLFDPLGQFAGQIPNPLQSKAHRAVSDFDLRHNFNANWVIALPFGSGQRYFGDATGIRNAVLGDWQVTGTWRWRSGFPLTPDNGFNFPTNFFLTGPGTLLRDTPTDVTSGGTGGPNLFSNPGGVLSNLAFTRPGAVGSRNVFRSDDYFSIDFGLGKTFRLSEKMRLQFRWEAFNLFNNVNFDSDDVSLDPSAPAIFGRFFSTAGGFPQQGAREMQFVLRFDF